MATKRNTKKDETKVASAEAVEVVATNDIPEGAEVVDGVTVDAPEVIIKDDEGNTLDTVADEAPEQEAKVKCKVVREFLDKTVLAKEGKIKAYRKVGTTFEADKARAEELAKLGYVKF